MCCCCCYAIITSYFIVFFKVHVVLFIYLFFHSLCVASPIVRVCSIANPLSGKSGDTGINRDFLCVEDRQFPELNYNQDFK